MAMTPPGAWRAPSTARNRDAILLILEPRLPAKGLVLEIASGAGEHAAFLAGALPGLTWLPTDPDPAALVSIEAWRGHAALPNLLEPRPLDAADPQAWPLDAADAVVCINMTHISPWAATQGLVAGAGRILPPRGLLYLYGPFAVGGVMAPTNALFDAELKARDPAWGVRDLEQIEALAAESGLALRERIVMPANNLSLVFVKG